MIREIREFYNIRQDQLADYLEISRSQLSMAEIKHRSLPTSALLALARLFTATQQPGSKIKNRELNEAFDIQRENHKKLIGTKLHDNQYKLHVLQRALKKMKNDQERSVKILESLPALRLKAEPYDGNFINILELNAYKLQKKTGGDAQLKLELEIEAALAKIAFLQKR